MTDPPSFDENRSDPPLIEAISRAFIEDKAATPPITLRAGNRIDDYREPVAFDAALDAVSDTYLEQYPWGVAYLDPASWRHYLPFLMEYALRHRSSADLIVEALLNSLRPPGPGPAASGIPLHGSGSAGLALLGSARL